MGGDRQDRRQRWGITRPAQAKRGRMGRPLTAPEAQAKGLVLTEDGVADPQKKEEELSAPKGWHCSKNAQGMEAEWPRLPIRLGSRQPDQNKVWAHLPNVLMH